MQGMEAGGHFEEFDRLVSKMTPEEIDFALAMLKRYRDELGLQPSQRAQQDGLPREDR